MYTDLALNDQDYYHAILVFQLGYLIAGTPSKLVKPLAWINIQNTSH